MSLLILISDCVVYKKAGTAKGSNRFGFRAILNYV